jgi:hypothetical protein
MSKNLHRRLPKSLVQEHDDEVYQDVQDEVEEFWSISILHLEARPLSSVSLSLSSQPVAGDST